MHIALPLIQVHDRVADQLPGTMIRHISAAIGRVDGNARAVQYVFAGEQIITVRIAAQGDDVRVLDKQELIRDQAGFAVAGVPALGSLSAIRRQVPVQVVDPRRHFGTFNEQFTNCNR